MAITKRGKPTKRPAKPKKRKPVKAKPPRARKKKKKERIKISAEARDMETAMELSLEKLSRRAKELYGVQGSVAVAVNRDGSVDGELRLTRLEDKDGTRAYDIMFNIDVLSNSKEFDEEGKPLDVLPIEQRPFVPPADTWISIGAALSHWTSKAFEEEVEDLEEDLDIGPGEAIEEVRSRYARFQGLDFVANYPQMNEKMHDTQVTARDIMQRAIANRGGYVSQIVYRLYWSPEGERPEHLKTKAKVE